MPLPCFPLPAALCLPAHFMPLPSEMEACKKASQQSVQEAKSLSQASSHPSHSAFYGLPLAMPSLPMCLHQTTNGIYRHALFLSKCNGKKFLFEERRI